MQVDIGLAAKFVASVVDLSTKTGETECLSFGFTEVDGKLLKRVEIGASGFPATELGEVVRVYINLDNLSCLSMVIDAFSMALQPFFVRRPDLVFLDMSEGFKIHTKISSID